MIYTEIVNQNVLFIIMGKTVHGGFATSFAPTASQAYGKYGQDPVISVYEPLSHYVAWHEGPRISASILWANFKGQRASVPDNNLSKSPRMTALHIDVESNFIKTFGMYTYHSNVCPSTVM